MNLIGKLSSSEGGLVLWKRHCYTVENSAWKPFIEDTFLIVTTFKTSVFILNKIPILFNHIC